MPFTGLGRPWYNPAFRVGERGMQVTGVNDKKAMCVTKSGSVETAPLNHEEKQ